MENLERFSASFEQAAREQLGDGEIISELEVDVIASLSELDPVLLNAIARLEPLGHHNPAPVFCTLGVEALGASARILKDQHLKVSFRQGDTVVPAIGFNMAERFYTEDLTGLVDIAYTPQFNVWRGETTIQLLLKDIRPAAG
jgi:single-stranded-DNA-specific exonuclease